MLADMFPRDLVAPETFRPISRREYDQMVEMGMFQDERIELLRGALVTKGRQDWHHASVIQWLTTHVIRQLDEGLAVRALLPFAADEWSEPEPDIAVVVKDYTRHDHPSEALLVVEVSDESLHKDRGLKREIYASAGVPEYWIIDLSTMTVAVHTKPNGPLYEEVETLRDGDLLHPTLLPGLDIRVADLPR